MRHVGSHWHLTVHKDTKIEGSRNWLDLVRIDVLRSLGVELLGAQHIVIGNGLLNKRHRTMDQTTVIRKLQSVLHAAARLVTGVRWNEHITPTLRDTLHWLHVRHRITYKIATMAFRCVRGACSAYFTDVCIPVKTVARRVMLRSARYGELIVPPTMTKTFGSRSFRSAAPTVWNSLPHLIISVKVTLVEDNSLVV